MSREQRIKSKLLALAPHYLEVIDDSYLHRSHLGNPEAGNGETHFTIKIAAIKLQGQTLLNQHSQINNLLKTEFSRGMHALVIKIINK